MTIKVFEVRDRATFLPVLAVTINVPGDENEAERYLLMRAGYSGSIYTLLVKLDGIGRLEYDPFAWGDRTVSTAHRFIQEHWPNLRSGDVIDVEYILGETKSSKKSERLGREAR